ncbi:MAG TPA: hypothetical protein VM782_05020, partial [Stellaceae bacterium]|nr:hypothetical protein [Stellaceae bacterium]
DQRCKYKRLSEDCVAHCRACYKYLHELTKFYAITTRKCRSGFSYVILTLNLIFLFQLPRAARLKMAAAVSPLDFYRHRVA